MLSPWLELDGVRQRLSDWSELTGLDLIRLGTTADEDEVQDTAVTQPLVVAQSLIGATAIGEVELSVPTAGHSVGELTAAALAGALDFDDAVLLANVRGREMAAACALEPTGMSAVLGGEQDEVLRHLEALGLDPANMNGGGQIVAAGHRTALEELAAQPPEGARVRPLKVAGAFHTRFMAPARDTLREFIANITIKPPNRPWLSNADGKVVSDPEEIRTRLVEQVTKPVRWDHCMATLAELGVDVAVELPPAGTLAGMVRRELKDITTVACKRPEHVHKVEDVLGADHSGSDT